MRPLLSICIPTFNRSRFLEGCLFAITSQFRNKKIYQKVEIVISDNNSKDNTRVVVKKFQERYKNIQYFKRKRNVRGDKNIIESALFSKGMYIWFFSDDDIHYSWSIKTVLNIIEGYRPDGIICNLDLCSKDEKKMLDKNMLHLKKDAFVNSKKQLFTFLETKFFLPLDWYITCLSNTIVSSQLYQRSLPNVMKYYNPKTINFLHSGLIYYNNTDYKIYMMSKSVAKFRADNRAFGPDEHTHKAEYLTYLYKFLKKHNDLILKINKKNISLKFRLFLYLKNLTRSFRLAAVSYFDYDISGILIRLFQKKDLS